MNICMWHCSTIWSFNDIHNFTPPCAYAHIHTLNHPHPNYSASIEGVALECVHTDPKLNAWEPVVLLLAGVWSPPEVVDQGELSDTHHVWPHPQHLDMRTHTCTHTHTHTLTYTHTHTHTSPPSWSPYYREGGGGYERGEGLSFHTQLQ